MSLLRLRSSLAVLVFAAGLAGCYAAPRPSIYNRMRSFDEAEYAAFSGNGTASISGQAFMKTRGGDVKYGAGETVTLNPVTTYSTEWWTVAVQRGVSMSEPDPRTSAYNRVATADGQGRFEFKGLPAGEYFVACSISWEYAGYRGYARRTGGTVGARVKVGPGEKTEVILQPVSYQ